MRNILIILGVFLTALGCTKGPRTPADTLVVAISSQPSTLDPRVATDAYGVRIAGLIFNALVRVGPGFNPIPDAAESWTLKDHVYTFRLRKDLKFHSGRPLTAEDVDFSFEQYRLPGNPYATSLDIIESVKTRDENGTLCVDIRLKYLSDKFLIGDLPIIKLLPKAEVLAAGPDFQKHPIGTGAFRFSAKKMNQIFLESVYAKIPKLQFKVVRDDFTRYQKLRRGEVDLVQADLLQDKVAEFQRRKDEFQVFVYPGWSMNYLLINFKDPVLSQLPVRRALAQTIDRAAIIEHKLEGLGEEATSILTPLNPYFHHELKNLSQDVEAAQAVIDKLGLKGTRLTLKTSNAPSVLDYARVLVNQMRQTGLNIELQSYEWGTFYSDVKKGNFQMATMRWVGIVDPDIFRNVYHSREFPPGRNRGSYNNPKLDTLLDQGAKEENVIRRQAIYREVQKMALDDLAIIPLWYNKQVAVARKSVQGYVPEPSGEFTSFLKISKVEEK